MKRAILFGSLLGLASLALAHPFTAPHSGPPIPLCPPHQPNCIK